MNTTRSILSAALLLPMLGLAQERFSTRNGEVSFFSSTPMENIEAVNHKATSVLDATSGAIEFSVLIKAFEFEKALMQEHFNENYMESNTYPKATFKGRITGISAQDIRMPGQYPVTVEGDLTMHGVTKHVTAPGIINVEPTAAVKATSTFNVKPADYNIKIPAMVRGKIAEEIQVKVAIAYEHM
ncbi:MAG: YceI family protein [Flavobacteriales bacterium]